MPWASRPASDPHPRVLHSVFTICFFLKKTFNSFVFMKCVFRVWFEVRNVTLFWQVNSWLPRYLADTASLCVRGLPSAAMLCCHWTGTWRCTAFPARCSLVLSVVVRFVFRVVCAPTARTTEHY